MKKIKKECSNWVWLTTKVANINIYESPDPVCTIRNCKRVLNKAYHNNFETFDEAFKVVFRQQTLF